MLERNAMDSRLHSLKQSLEQAMEGMSSEQWIWHLPGKWCAAEVLEHLYLTYTAVAKAPRGARSASPQTASPAPRRREEAVALKRVVFFREEAQPYEFARSIIFSLMGGSELAVPRWQLGQPSVSEFASSASFFRVFLSLCFPCADNATVPQRFNSQKLKVPTLISNKLIKQRFRIGRMIGDWANLRVLHFR
jgi:hypothetical protein